MTTISNDTLPLESQLVDAMRDGLAIFDPAGNLLRWNSSARAITGWTPGEAGRRGLAALPPGVIQIREGKWADARHLQIEEGERGLVEGEAQVGYVAPSQLRIGHLIDIGPIGVQRIILPFGLGAQLPLRQVVSG